MAQKKERAGRGDDRRARLNLDPEKVVAQAVAGLKRGSQTLNLPPDVKEWRPEKAGDYLLRFLPFVVSQPNHPDNVKVGHGAYRMPYGVHMDVGGSGKAVVCPTITFGEDDDAVCAKVRQLRRDYKANADIIQRIKGQMFCLFAIVDTKNEPDIVQVFSWK